MSDNSRHSEESAATQEKPLPYGYGDGSRDEIIRQTWNRLRHYSPADLEAMKQVVANRREYAGRWHNRFVSRENADGIAKMSRLLQQTRTEMAVLDQLIIHHFQHGTTPVPKWENVDYNENEITIAGSKEDEIRAAARELIEAGDYPEYKTKFYAEIDRMRELSPTGRATENWLRDNRPKLYLEPEEWREELDL